MKKKPKIIIICLSGVTLAIVLTLLIPFTIMGIKTNKMSKDFAYLENDNSYSQKVEISSNLNLVKQHISCGYATIEMLSEYYDKKVTEDDLSDKHNGGISTSSTDGFLKEINASISSKEFIKKTYLTNDNFLKEIHGSISRNNPVAIEWAALYEEKEWTLHFSIVTALDLANDNVTIYNPYGYIENITCEEFINRTTFKAYKNLPLFLNFGFAFGAFHKNTLFYAK